MTQIVALALVIGGLLFVAARRLRCRRLVNAIFARGDALDLSRIHRQLEQINHDSRDFTLTACRAVAIPVNGRLVPLVEGKAGHVVFGIRNPFWQNDRCLFVIAEEEDVGWFSEQKDVFREALPGTRFSVFWVFPRNLQAP